MAGKLGTARGGELPPMMAAEDYLRNAIALANAADDHPHLVDLYQTAINVQDKPISLLTPTGLEAKTKGAKALRRELIRQFEKIARRRRHPDLSDVSRFLGQVDTVTTLGVTADGALEHRHRYFPMSLDGAVGLAVAFLLDPAKPFAGKFGVCALPSCSQFFIAPRDQKGRRRYCSNEHQQAADRADVAERVRRYRLRKHK